MKMFTSRAVILLTLVAVSLAQINFSQASKGEVTEETLEYLENVKYKANQSIEKLNNSTAKVVFDISNVLTDEIKEAHFNLDKTIQNILKLNFGSYKVEVSNEIAIRCVIYHEPALRQTVEEGKIQSTKWIEKSVSDIGDIFKPVKSFMTNIEEEVKTLDGVIKKCWNPNSPIESETCILQDAVKVQQKVKKNLNDGEYFINEQNAGVLEQVVNARLGMKEILDKTFSNVEIITRKIVACVILGKFE